MEIQKVDDTKYAVRAEVGLKKPLLPREKTVTLLDRGTDPSAAKFFMVLKGILPLEPQFFLKSGAASSGPASAPATKGYLSV